MRVLMITDNYYLEEVNGVYYHRYIDEHIKAYSLLGDIKLLLPIRHEISVNRPVDLSQVSVRAIDKENTIYKRFINRRSNKAIIEEEVKNSDIVIGFVPSSVCDIAQSYAQKYNKKFLSVVIASAWDILWYHSIFGKLMAPISHFCTSRTIRKSDYVIYVTDQYLQKKYPTNGSSIGISDVIVPQPTYSFLIERISKIQNKTDRKKLSIATIGAVDVKYKAQDDVIKAMSILKSDGYDVEYTLIGGGSPERLKQVALDYGLELEKLHFLGTIPHEEIYELLDNFDLYIQPSRTEGLPRSVVEAMSRGLLCICSNVGGMPELVDAKCIYKPGNFRELAEVVEKLIESDEEVVQIIKDNFQKASQFQEEILVNRRSRFLNEIIRTYEL